MPKLRVRSITWEAEQICSFELVDPEGKELPPFEAGAHLDIQVPGGHSRRYSICSSPSDRHHYQVAVLDLPKGRGGSHAMHQRVKAGDLMDISGPHNFFRLEGGLGHTILLAGGIGITPIMAMVESLRRSNSSFEVHYCAKSGNHAAFLERLSPEIAAGKAKIYFDDGDPSKGLDIEQLLKRVPPDTHLYYCGPAGFMEAARKASEHWPDGSIHCEYFGTDPTIRVKRVAAPDAATVILDKQDITITLDGSQTILEAIRAAGVECDSSCEAGMCGSCKVSYISGRPGHNDLILSEDEREDSVLICCATVEEGPLVLDM